MGAATHKRRTNLPFKRRAFDGLYKITTYPQPRSVSNDIFVVVARHHQDGNVAV
jgi:hypothetical protein